MEIDKQGIKQEAEHCSDKVQSIVDRHINLSMTQQKFRNMLQIILQDEIIDMDIDIDSITYFQTFASVYECADNIQQCKQDLLDLLNKDDGG